MAFRKTEERRQNRPRESVLKVAARSVERRRTVRRRLGWTLALLAGVPALAVGLAWGGHAAWRAMFAENEFFEIRQIEVTTDGDLGAENILEYARVRKGLNLFAVRPEDIRGSLLSVPVIANAQVGRRLPDTLVIEVAERVSVARSKGLDLAVYDMTVDRNYVGRPATWVDPAEGTEE